MVEVTQADRDAAADALDAMGVDWGACGDVRSGRVEHPLPQAFAAHAAREREGMIAWLRAMSDCFNRNNEGTSPRCERCTGCGRSYAADAFERGEDKETDRG
jgi:hypothetical protein